MGPLCRAQLTRALRQPHTRLDQPQQKPRINGYEHQIFRSLEEFQPLMQAQNAGWNASVKQHLQQIALGGIRDPISEEPIPPRELLVEHGNFRETVGHGGVISRQRAVLLVLRQLHSLMAHQWLLRALKIASACSLGPRHQVATHARWLN